MKCSPAEIKERNNGLPLSFACFILTNSIEPEITISVSGVAHWAGNFSINDYLAKSS